VAEGGGIIHGPLHSADNPADSPPLSHVQHREILWAVAGIIVILWGLALFGFVDLYPWVSALVVVLGAWGLGVVAISLSPKVRSPRLEPILGWATVAMVVGAFVAWGVLQIINAPGYGTDEIAFNQYAAQLAAHGLNPYTHSMAAALSQFHVSPNGYTFLLDGTAVTSLSYPALSFLFYVPFVALGWTTQTAVVLNLVAWALGIVVTFVLLPRSLRPIALVLGSLGIYTSYAVGGVTDAVFVPLLVGAVFKWDRFATERGLSTWRGPLLLGLAMAVKQTPWLILPFLAAGICIEGFHFERSIRRGVHYVLIALGAFLIPNIVFIIASPWAWWSGVLTPLRSQTVPAGQGLVELTLFEGLGGGSLAAYSVTLVVVLLGLFAIFVSTYPVLKSLAVVLPAIVLYFAARSFGSYLVTLLPAALVAATSVRSPTIFSCRADRESCRKPPDRLPMWHYWKLVVAMSIAASAVAILVVFLYAAPLSIQIAAVRTSGQLATVVEIELSVTNNAGTEVQPHFTVESGGTLTSFWVTRGPRHLAPGHRANYVLLAPNFFAQPPISGGFQVVAFTTDPASVSRSSTYLPTPLHVSLAPSAVNGVVPIGHPITVHAALLNSLDAPVHDRGQPIYLGQIVYAQDGLRLGNATINSGAPGQTPVVAYTNAQGVATFVVLGTQAGNDPVYFEANLVNLNQFYPYGYSDLLPIRFGG